MADLFEWTEGEPHFRGLRVERRCVRVGSYEFHIAALQDAAALLDDAELIKEFERTDRLPYGLELWPAAVMLASHVAQSETGNGRSAIELGCGVGLVSLAAARRGWRITTTDVDPTALRFAEFNAVRNRVVIGDYRLIDWRDPPAGSRYARVFAADVLYQLIDHRPLIGCLDALLDTDGIAFVADPNRAVADRFPALAEETGFKVRVEAASTMVNEKKSVAGRIFVLTRSRKTSAPVEPPT